MILIVGLGNPGEKYEHTWHNMGFLALDKFKEKNSLPDFIFSQKFVSEVSDGVFGKKEITLAKPHTFMNNSGKSVKVLLRNQNLKKEDLILVHDDIDLPLGTMKIVKDRGAAGHNGVQSVIDHLGSQDFLRVRIGIQPQRGKPDNPELFVLKRISKKDSDLAEKILENSALALEKIVLESSEKAMNEFNGTS